MSIIRRRTTAAIDGEQTRSTRNGRVWRRIGRGTLVVAAGTAALALAGPFALRPFVDAAHAAGTAGEVPVAFVLDFGGSAKSQVVGCVTVPSSDNRYYALSAFLQEQGLAQPTYANSGLLCSINGIPSSGCGQTVAGGYIYWSYWTGGSGGWTYAQTGASGLVGTDDVEGWRFQNPGSANPSDPPPRTAPRYDSICGSTPSTTAPSGGGSPGHETGAHHAHGDQGVKAGVAGAGGAAGTAGAAKPDTTTTSSPTTTTSTYPSDTSTSLPSVSVPADPEVGLANAKHATSGSSGPGPDPLIIGGLLIAALAIAGYTRWRKRPRTP
jgi:hypothetical protein